MHWRVVIVRSPLVQAAGMAIRLTPWWAAYLVTFGIVVVAALAITPAVFVLADFPIAVSLAAAAVLLYLTIGLLLAGWIHWYERRPLASVGFIGRDSRRQVATGFGVGAAALGVITLVLTLLGAVHLTPTSSGTFRVDALLPAVALIPVWLFLAAVQEALSRGFLLQVTALQVSAWAAIVGQAVLWGIVRAAASGTTDVMSLLNLLCAGVLLAVVALTRGSLWLALGLQAGWSWFATAVLGTTTAGGPEPHTILSLVPSSASWLSGGRDGIAASPAVTVPLVVAIWFASRRLPRLPSAG